MEETINLQEMFEIVKKRANLILFTTVIGLVVSTIATFLVITPKFESQVSLIVKSTNSSISNITNNVAMVNTYKELVKSDAVLDNAVKNLNKEKGLNFTSAQLRGVINIDQPQNSQLFYLKVKTINAEEAAFIANVVAKNFEKEAIKTIPENKLETVSSATVNHSPVSPNKGMNLAIGVLVGLMLGVGLAFMFDFMDQSIRNKEFIESLGISILGEISEIHKTDLQKMLSMKQENINTQNLTEKSKPVKRIQERV
ncbi:MAG: tyrosine protein kinase [Streptococcaceae bacterium]|jgi:capsular polysaccharide biosynthesis protein|nr:tyrosine protein kinase [Streptococcaceae bacterium]